MSPFTRSLSDSVQPKNDDQRGLPNLGCLVDGECLDGDIISRYLDILCRDTNVYPMSTYFYSKLKENGYDAVQRWTRKVITSLYSSQFQRKVIQSLDVKTGESILKVPRALTNSSRRSLDAYRD